MKLDAGERIDQFMILAPLGQGGMSEVYKARDERTDQIVVLKIPYDTLLSDPATYQRFHREVQIGKLLNNPHVQHTLGTGGSESHPYLINEYVEGESLDEIIRQRAPLPVAEAVSIGRQVCAALEYCHGHGVFHRDLKPTNIMVTASGQVKVMDFGVALLQGASRVTWRHLSAEVGTPDYMAPEQIQGGRGDARTDIYALGIVLYEMMAGVVPFHGDNPLAVMSQHLNSSAIPLDKRNPAVPEALAKVVARALARVPRDRYQTAAELSADLARAERPELGAAAGGGDAAPGGVNRVVLIGAAASVIILLVLIVVLAQLFRGGG